MAKLLSNAIGKIGYHLTSPLIGVSAISLVQDTETPIDLSFFTTNISNKFTNNAWTGVDGSKIFFTGSSIAYTSSSNVTLIYRLYLNGNLWIETTRLTEAKFMSFVANREMTINNADVISFTIEADANIDLEIYTCDLSFLEI